MGATKKTNKEITLSDSILFTTVDRNGTLVRIEKNTGEEQIVDHYYNQFGKIIRNENYFVNQFI